MTWEKKSFNKCSLRAVANSDKILNVASNFRENKLLKRKQRREENQLRKKTPHGTQTQMHNLQVKRKLQKRKIKKKKILIQMKNIKKKLTGKLRAFNSQNISLIM